MRGILAIVAGAAVLTVWGVGEREARAQPAVDAAVISGVDQDLTAVGRLLAGGIWSFGKFAPEAHIGVDGFLRIDSDRGIAARSFSLINLGARYAFTSERFAGPYVTAGGGFGIFTGKPHERRIADDPEVCESARNQTSPGDCTYRIDKNLNARFGFGYGFQSGNKTTVAARVDVHYWMLSLNDFEDQPEGAPIPNMVDRPQSTWTVTIGLEFMRWR